MHMKEALLSHPHTLRSPSHSWPSKPISLTGTKNREKEDKVLLFFFIGKTICPNLQRDASHHPPIHSLPSLVPISRATPIHRHTHTHASRYLDRDALLSAAELLGVCVCICVCVNVFMVSPNRKEEVPSSSFLLYHVFFRGKWEKKNKKKSGQTHTMQGEREREKIHTWLLTSYYWDTTEKDGDWL